MDFTNGANGLGSDGLFMANMNRQQQQFVTSNPQLLNMQQEHNNDNNNPSSLNGAPMSNGDFQQLMMGANGSVMPSSETIASFMHTPQDMLHLGNSANAIFDLSASQAPLKTNSNSNSLLSMQQQANNGTQNIFVNQNQMSMFRQQQQPNNMPQAMPQPQQSTSNGSNSNNNNNNNTYQNAMFEQQRQQLLQHHDLQRQHLQQQQAQRLQDHETLQNKNTRNSKQSQPGRIVSSSFPQQSKNSVNPQRAVSVPTAAAPKKNTIGDSNNGTFTNFITEFFDMPNDFTFVDDNLFADTMQSAPMPLPFKKRKDDPPKTTQLPFMTTSMPTSTTQPMRASVSPPSARSVESPPLVSSSMPPLVPPLVLSSKRAPVVVSMTVHPPAPPSLLHQACFLYPTTVAVVNSALGVDSNNVRRRVPTPAKAMLSIDNDAGSSSKRRKVIEPYSLPLHIALDNGASKDVIEALINAGPDVISMIDGPESCTAISVALYKKCCPETIALLVKANPKALEVVDRHHNTALHVGCSKGASMEIIKLLYGVFPKALGNSNFHSQTPLDVAQRTTVCPLSVIDFLQALVLESLECRACHLVNSEDDELV